MGTFYNTCKSCLKFGNTKQALVKKLKHFLHLFLLLLSGTGSREKYILWKKHNHTASTLQTHPQRHTHTHTQTHTHTHIDSLPYLRLDLTNDVVKRKEDPMVFSAEEVALSVEKSIMSPNCKAQPFNSATPSSVGTTAMGGGLPDTPASIGPTLLN